MTNKENEIIKRQDAMIGLLVENMVASGLIGKGRAVEILNTAGLGPTEIGHIFNVPASSISPMLTRQKQQRSRKKSGKKN